MPRHFNVAGPCKPEIDYMLPAAARIPLARRLVAEQSYLVIHAPRQSGKTTAMTSLAQEWTASGDNGAVEREYAIGSGRMDLWLRYGGPQPVTLGMELKAWRDGEEDPLEEGLAQLDAYLDGVGLETGWPVVFDRRSGQPPIAKRTTAETAQSPAGHAITLIRA